MSKKKIDNRINNSRPPKKESEKKKPVAIYVRGCDIDTLGGEATVRSIMTGAVEMELSRIDHYAHVGLGPEISKEYIP